MNKDGSQKSNQICCDLVLCLGKKQFVHQPKKEQIVLKLKKEESITTPSNSNNGEKRINSSSNTNTNLVIKNPIDFIDQFDENVILENAGPESVTLQDVNVVNKNYQEDNQQSNTDKKSKKDRALMNSSYKSISQNEFHDKRPIKILDLSPFVIKIETSPKDLITLTPSS